MSSWLRSPGNEEEVRPLRPEVEAVLPPSVRKPEVNRFTPLGSDAHDDVDDEDMEFFTTLANEVDRAIAPKASAPAAIPLRGASPRIDDMRVFREMKDDGKQAPRYDFHLRDVDMADLLEELSTVQAALRQRKAA